MVYLGDEEFKQAYRITKDNGEFVTPKYLRNRILSYLRLHVYPQPTIEDRRRALDYFLDQESGWLKGQKGTTVGSVCRQAWYDYLTDPMVKGWSSL